MQRYRAIGSRLASYLQQADGRLATPAALQALVADLTAADTFLLPPLRDLVSRPAFQDLITSIGSGRASSQRDGLLQDLQATYAPTVVAAMAEVLNGLLDLPVAASGDPAPAAPAVPMAPVRAVPPVQVAAPRPAPIAPAVEPSRGGARLIAVSLVTAALAAGAVLVARDPQFCSSLGLCSQEQTSEASQQALDAAREAERSLRRAASLEDYRAHYQHLKDELLKLSGDRLTPDQERQLEPLQQAARDARDLLALEDRDRERLDRASAALVQARSKSGPEQQLLLNSIRQDLDAIPPRSFSAADASALREQLDQLLRTDPAGGTDTDQPPAVNGSGDAPQLVPPPLPKPAGASAPAAPTEEN